MASNLCLLVKWSVKESLLLTGSRRSPAVQLQSVRFRKPRWVPIAKSKEFYVRKPTPIIQEEYDELKHRYRLYRAEVESIRKFLGEKLLLKEASVTQLQEIDYNADLNVMREQVEEWNKRISVLRNDRQTQEELIEEQRLHDLMQKLAQDRMSQAAEARAALHRNKEASVKFIQADKLDDAIEKMLDSRSDYNYAITKSGDILPGEYPDRSEGSSSPSKTN